MNDFHLALFLPRALVIIITTFIAPIYKSRGECDGIVSKQANRARSG